MNYFKIIILIVCLFLGNIVNAIEQQANPIKLFPPEWVAIKNDKQKIWLDVRNIKENNNSLYYAILLKNKNEKLVMTCVQSKGSKATIINSAETQRYDDLSIFSRIYNIQKNATEFRQLTSESLLYNANNIAMELAGFNGDINLGQADFTEYLKSLEKNIKPNWRYSEIEDIGTGKAVITIKVAKDGRILDYKIKNSSSCSHYDKVAKNAVQYSQREINFKKYISGMLPTGFKGNSIDIDISFFYDTKQVIAQVATPNVDVKPNNTDMQNQVDFTAYMKDLQKRIKRNWHPVQTRTPQRVIVKFKITKTGELLDSKITKTSYDKNLDNAALNAIKSTKFKPLPNEYQEDSVEIEFTFDNNIIQ